MTPAPAAIESVPQGRRRNLTTGRVMLVPNAQFEKLRVVGPIVTFVRNVGARASFQSQIAHTDREFPDVGELRFLWCLSL